MNDVIERDGTLGLAVKVVAAYVGNNQCKPDEINKVLANVHNAITELSTGSPGTLATRDPFVPVNKSVTDDYIICLEDGAKLQMLKRYLRTHFDMSPEEYRRKWGLPHDYPMTAPNYSKRRSGLAKDIGLGTTATRSGRKPSKSTRRKKGIKKASKKKAA